MPAPSPSARTAGSTRDKRNPPWGGRRRGAAQKSKREWASFRAPGRELQLRIIFVLCKTVKGLLPRFLFSFFGLKTLIGREQSESQFS